MMFVPGNNPGMMADAHIYGPDSIMLDLEDSVTIAEKDTARLLVYNALRSVDYGDTEMVVRINPLNTPYGRKDIEAVVKAGVHVIRMPKTETAAEVEEVEREIEKVEREIGCLGRTRIMAAIESALGVVNAYAIATASPRMMGIALGAEDYCANLKTQRTPGGDELRLARETIVVAARAAGIDALDTVYSNLDDMETFRKLFAEKSGFVKAMWCGEQACEDQIKEEMAVTSRCMPFEQEQIGETCVCCGKPAKKMVYWGRAY